MNRDELINDLLEELEYDTFLEDIRVRSQFKNPSRPRPNTAMVKNAANAIASILNGVSKNPGEVKTSDGGVSMSVRYSAERNDSNDNFLSKNAFSRIAKMIQTRTRNLYVSVSVKGEFAGNYLTGMIVRISPSMKYKFKMK